ncbi:hypothetical protein [Marinobacter nauticus]|uniref:hypothetical protein n=1 Tax=Marinobacter nauticus TaxID=2743 RepID=UPI001CFD86CC|nr:hypothetical protein [Marinobacter nauticus]
MLRANSTTWLKVLFFLCLFSPYVKVAGRSVYLFDFLLIALVGFASMGYLAIRRRDLAYVFFAFSFSVFVIFVQSVLWGEVPGTYLVRLFFYFSIFFIIRELFRTADRLALIRFASNCVAFVALLGIFQVIDHYLFSGALGVTRLTSVLYPYPGELAMRSQELSNGLQLKVGSFFNATSSFDGHSILLGDFLAISLGFLLYFRKYFQLSITILCLLLTMSRGAWAMGLISIFVFSFVGFTKSNVKSSIWLFLIGALLLVGLLSIEVVREYMFFRVNNTLFTFGLVDEQVGRADDPRTSIVWPRLINSLSDLGWVAYLFGAPLNFSADSGYLTILRDSGISGFVLIGSFPMYILASSIDRKAVIRVLLVVAAGMIVHPVFQGIRTVLFCILIFVVFSLPTVRQSKAGVNTE